MTRNTTELRDCPQAAIKRSLKDNTGYQYRYTGVTRPLKAQCFSLLTKGDVRASSCHDLINMHEHHKAMAARCLSYHQATCGQPAIWALATAPLRRLALSVLFTIATNSYQTTCTVSERTFNKRQHTNARHRVDFSLFTHYDTTCLKCFGPKFVKYCDTIKGVINVLARVVISFTFLNSYHPAGTSVNLAIC